MHISYRRSKLSLSCLLASHYAYLILSSPFHTACWSWEIARTPSVWTSLIRGSSTKYWNPIV